MGKDVICINGSFPPDYVEFYQKHGVVTPEQGKLYTVREVINHASKTAGGDTVGILLEEIVNPPVPIQTAILSGNREPSWAISRFRNLDGTELEADEVREMVKEGFKEIYIYK
jgi:hypothetical protein